MPVFSSEGKFSRFSSVVKASNVDKFEFLTDVVVANEAAPTVYTLGSVLGKVTATGKFVTCVRTATDGSQVPAAIYIGDGKMGATVDTNMLAATDTPILVISRGKVIVTKEGLKLHNSFSTDAHKQTAYDALKALQIFAEVSF